MLAEIERGEDGHRRESGHIDRGNARIDYDYDVSTGLDSGASSSRDRSASDRRRTERSTDREAERDPIHVETREVATDELVVIADLPEVTDDDLDVTLDADEPALELRDGEDTVGRIALDQSDVTITDVTLNNQILEIRLARTSESNGSDSDD
jgi:HSP20 family molecular chaperone IbpA